MMVLGLALTHQIIAVVLFYGVGYLAIRRGLTLGGAPPGETGFQPGSFENLVAKSLPRGIVRGVWVCLGLFFAAIPTLTIIGVLAWPSSGNSNSQRDARYIDTVDQIMTPFAKQSWSTTDLSAAIRTLGRLVPPSQFATSQTRLVAALRAQAALDPLIDRANARHDAAAVNNLESQVQSTEDTITTAVQAIVRTYDGCKSDGFRTC